MVVAGALKYSPGMLGATPPKRGSLRSVKYATLGGKKEKSVHACVHFSASNTTGLLQTLSVGLSGKVNEQTNKADC